MTVEFASAVPINVGVVLLVVTSVIVGTSGGVVSATVTVLALL